MILDDIVKKTKERVYRQKMEVSYEVMKKQALQMGKTEPFIVEEILQKPGMHIIAEVKKASPSKGVIVEDFPYVAIAKAYEEAGASIISCLTEPDFFQGSDTYLQEIKQQVNIPVLRKDFVIDSYQLYQAKVLGADMVLLIVAILNQELLAYYLRICDELGLSALVEVHDEKEMQKAIDAHARIIGVNNRNLKNFTVNVGNSEHLRSLAPSSCIFVAESGIQNSADVKRLYDAKVNAVLIGETLMRSLDKKAMMKQLLAKCV